MGHHGSDLVRISDLTAGIEAYSTDFKMKENSWEFFLFKYRVLFHFEWQLAVGFLPCNGPHIQNTCQSVLRYPNERQIEDINEISFRYLLIA